MREQHGGREGGVQAEIESGNRIWTVRNLCERASSGGGGGDNRSGSPPPSAAICPLMNVIRDKLKADYFLEGAGERLAPAPPRRPGDG